LRSAEASCASSASASSRRASHFVCRTANIRTARSVSCNIEAQETLIPSTPSRRSALLSGPVLLSAALFVKDSVLLQPSSAEATATAAVDWQAVRKDIVEVIADPASPGGIGERGPTIVRLAWHSSGTYDKMTRTGGSGGGTIRFKEELSHGANAGLDKPVSWLEPVKAKHPGVSYADLYTLAGAVAIEAMGGPTIAWRAGRVDALDPSAVTPDGRLPEADQGSPPKTAAALRTVFYRMGFDDREIVALSGAHALGRCHAENTGYVGPWDGTPTIFSNIYYKFLLKINWTPDERYPKLQYKDPSGSFMMLPSDLVLIQDPDFKQYVELYAKEKKTFYKDFADAFAKLEELGTSGLVTV
jgi:cytochrome c peroxidase